MIFNGSIHGQTWSSFLSDEPHLKDSQLVFQFVRASTRYESQAQRSLSVDNSGSAITVLHFWSMYERTRRGSEQLWP